MRLGDLDALRKNMEFVCMGIMAGSEPYNAPLTEIDNATTVVNEYTKGFADGERSGRNFPLTDEEKAILVRQWRPQGEWINREAVSNTTFPFWERYECDQCHKFNGYSNYCPNCGADMRKGEKE